MLRILKDAGGGPISGQRISDELGVSRVAVANAVHALRNAGYAIRSTPHVGHRLEARSPRLLPAEVLDGLTTRWAGRHVIHHDVLGSTQTHAAALAPGEAPHGTLVIAEEQTAGRGRLGKRFWSPAGGLWCTLVIRQPMPSEAVPLLGLAAGVAVSLAVEAGTGVPPVLKWPNDLLIGEAKVAGVLVEVEAEEQVVRRTLVGLGINVNGERRDFPEELAARMTTLQEATGQRVDRRRLLQRYLEEMERLTGVLLAGDGDAVVAAWRGRPNMLGRRVRVERWDGDAIEGIAEGLGPDGGLEVRDEAGVAIPVRSGTVRLLAPRAHG